MSEHLTSNQLELLREIAGSGVSYDAGKYLEVQIGREAWDQLQALVRNADETPDSDALDCPTCGQGHCGPAAAELRARLADTTPASPSAVEIAELRRENQVASDFMRRCIEALGMEQPPINTDIDTYDLWLQIVGQLEQLKAEIVECGFPPWTPVTRSAGCRHRTRQTRSDGTTICLDCGAALKTECVHEFRPFDSSGQTACIWCNAKNGEGVSK